MGELDRAEALFRAAMERDPDDARARLRARVVAEVGDGLARDRLPVPEDMLALVFRPAHLGHP